MYTGTVPVSQKFTHPINMDILESPDFGDPIVNTGAPFCLQKFMMRPTLVVEVQFAICVMCKMSESGKIRCRGDYMRSKYCENRGSRDGQELQPEEKTKGNDGRFLSTVSAISSTLKECQS